MDGKCYQTELMSGGSRPQKNEIIGRSAVITSSDCRIDFEPIQGAISVQLASVSLPSELPDVDTLRAFMVHAPIFLPRPESLTFTTTQTTSDSVGNLLTSSSSEATLKLPPTVAPIITATGDAGSILATDAVVTTVDGADHGLEIVNAFGTNRPYLVVVSLNKDANAVLEYPITGGLLSIDGANITLKGASTAAAHPAYSSLETAEYATPGNLAPVGGDANAYIVFPKLRLVDWAPILTTAVRQALGDASPVNVVVSCKNGNLPAIEFSSKKPIATSAAVQIDIDVGVGTLLNQLGFSSSIRAILTKNAPTVEVVGGPPKNTTLVRVPSGNFTNAEFVTALQNRVEWPSLRPAARGLVFDLPDGRQVTVSVPEGGCFTPTTLAEFLNLKTRTALSAGETDDFPRFTWDATAERFEAYGLSASPFSIRFDIDDSFAEILGFEPRSYSGEKQYVGSSKFSHMNRVFDTEFPRSPMQAHMLVSGAGDKLSLHVKPPGVLQKSSSGFKIGDATSHWHFSIGDVVSIYSGSKRALIVAGEPSSFSLTAASTYERDSVEHIVPAALSGMADDTFVQHALWTPKVTLIDGDGASWSHFSAEARLPEQFSSPARYFGLSGTRHVSSYINFGTGMHLHAPSVILVQLNVGDDASADNNLHIGADGASVPIVGKLFRSSCVFTFNERFLPFYTNGRTIRRARITLTNEDDGSLVDLAGQNGGIHLLIEKQMQ
jgi:hypothetical protein